MDNSEKPEWALAAETGDKEKSLELLVSELLEDAISQASKGDHNAARHVVGVVARYLKEGRSLPVGLASFLGDALSEIYQGKDPSRALHLVAKRQRPSASPLLRSAIAVRVHEYRHSGDGMTRDEALNRVADEVHKSYKAVEKIYDAWRNGKFNGLRRP